MATTFLYSDPHFSHKGVCHFLCQDGVTKIRPFDNPDEMDEELVRRFNDKVKVGDKCYFLGDVAINRRGLSVLGRLNCKNLVLIKGNHDVFPIKDYLAYFRDIRAYHVMTDMILSHVPLHSDNLTRFGTNVHGHLHADVMKLPDGKVDTRYVNVCVEHTDFAPISLEEVRKIVEYQIFR